MIFGKIDYLNLLPFHVFLKRYPLTNGLKKAIEFKKGVPSKLNKELKNRKIDAAVISSAAGFSKRFRHLKFGIVAKAAVKSVLVRKDSKLLFDTASASSNYLSKVLGLSGEVIIGDRALKAYLNEGSDKFYDLGEIWHKRTNLPFVFGRFSCVKYYSSFERLTKSFHKKNIKIPNYILTKYSQTRNISPKDIRWYLKFISYTVEKKEQIALAKFAKEIRQLKNKALPLKDKAK